MRYVLVAAAVCGMVGAGPAAARKPVETGTPGQIKGLLACRAITDAAQRLSCFDRETAGIDQALTAKNLVVVDREQANAARRSLFGFSLPSFGGLFGGEQDEVKQLDSTVASARRNVEGGWTVTLADGSVWTQTDDTPVALAPRKGDKILVRRRALGSYTLAIGSQPGVKVRRIG
jgi:hypothetical protein